MKLARQWEVFRWPPHWLCKCSNVQELINTVGKHLDCYYYLCVWMMWCNGIWVWILYRTGIPNYWYHWDQFLVTWLARSAQSAWLARWATQYSLLVLRPFLVVLGSVKWIGEYRAYKFVCTNFIDPVNFSQINPPGFQGGLFVNSLDCISEIPSILCTFPFFCWGKITRE